jgi:phosphoglucosamine mutase
MTSAVVFGTDGIRGVAGELPCTSEVGVAIGRAAVRLAREDGGNRVLVARDTRPSGPMLEAAVVAGVTAEGGQCLLAGVLPTSGLAAALAAGLADTGVMLTASHNAWPDNGFKVLGRGGRKLSDAENHRVEDWLVSSPAPARPGGLADAHEEAWEVYGAALDRALPDRRHLRGRRLAIDLANGAAVPAQDWLLAEVPAAEIVFVGAGIGRTNDGVGSEHIEALQRVVRDERCDAGFAVDGDGDRCRVVTERGLVVDGDALAWLLARGRGDRSIAVTVMSNAALEPSLPGVRVVRTPVGDRHLAEAMAGTDVTLGCEESGHVLFHDALPTGDGLVTGLRALCLGLASGALSAAVAGFRPFPRELTKIAVARRRPLSEVPELASACAQGEAALGGGRVFLRYSGTEPVLRVLVEGVDPDTVARVSADVTRVASETLG